MKWVFRQGVQRVSVKRALASKPNLRRYRTCVYVYSYVCATCALRVRCCLRRCCLWRTSYPVFVCACGCYWVGAEGFNVHNLNPTQPKPYTT